MIIADQAKRYAQLMAIFALIVGWAVSIGYAYMKGAEIEGNRRDALTAKALDGAIKQHNEDAVSDMQAAAEAAEEAGRRQRAADQRQHALAMEAKDGQLVQAVTAAVQGGRQALANARCELSAAGVSVFRDAVENYNRAAAGSGGGADAVPAPPAVPRRGDGGLRPMDARGTDDRLALRMDAQGIRRVVSTGDQQEERQWQ